MRSTQYHRHSRFINEKRRPPGVVTRHLHFAEQAAVFVGGIKGKQEGTELSPFGGGH